MIIMTQNLEYDKTFVLSAQSTLVKNAFQALATMSKQRPVFIAISGESASGKTTFLKTLQNILKNYSFIDADNYFKDLSKEIQKAGSFANLVDAGYKSDAPECFMLDRLDADLKALRQGQSVLIPHYDMKTGVSTLNATRVNPTPFIFVGGICSLYDKVVSNFDFRIYLQADEKLRLQRYMDRAHERGQSQVDAWRLYGLVQKMAEEYVIPTRAKADIVVRGRMTQRHLQKVFINTIREMTRGD